MFNEYIVNKDEAGEILRLHIDTEESIGEWRWECEGGV